MFSCGGGIGWKIFKCHQKEQRRARLQEEIRYVNYIYMEVLHISTDNQLNENNLSANKADVRKT
jgi:hypothetical protein